MTQAAAERPLVTFALFAYNQEKYIREAVEGAFAQTYQPLEIILSDDCSSDRTFEIMQEMAAKYKGPHQVRATRNIKNLGVTQHFLTRCKEAKGGIIVVAAGDDISLPTRVAEHVPEYDDLSVAGVSSAFNLIDSAGQLIAENQKRPIGARAHSEPRTHLRNVKHEYIVIQGSTASYRRSIFAVELPEWPIRFSEDNLMNFVIYARGFRVSFLNQSLINYRMHPLALSNTGRKLQGAEFERASLIAAHKRINKLETFKWISIQSNGAIDYDAQSLQRDVERTKTVILWAELSSWQRISALLRDIVDRRFVMLKWKMARIFGCFPNYQPKIFIDHLKHKLSAYS